ncbi:MAG: SLC13 family permease [Bacillota bacterium]|nr:SLC13 family permease [Bacillota bacterium]
MMLKRIVAFIRREAILCCSALLAVGSMLLVPPSTDYWDYIDWPVLSLLLCLMLVVGGWRSLGLFRSMGSALVRRVRGSRGLGLVLVGLCFFSSMLITNDVALITFIPFTISFFVENGLQKQLIPVISLETVAANLGSMLTPIGNPQNLYLFSLGGWSAGEFLLLMAPLTLLSLVAIALLLWLRPNEALLASAAVQGEKAIPGLRNIAKSWRFWLYSLLFAVCLCQVFHVLPFFVVLLLVLLAVLCCDASLLKQADYSLLLTFICFFVFVGNVQNMPAVRDWLSALISGRELWLGIAASQVVSNVPAAFLLSGFSQNYSALLWGVNIGGLGTLIASMASLISYKYYVNMEGAKPGSYLLVFTAYNLALLAVLCLAILFF